MNSVIYLPSKSTSPTSFVLPSGVFILVMPTSITAAPGFTMSAFIKPTRPMLEENTGINETFGSYHLFLYIMLITQIATLSFNLKARKHEYSNIYGISPVALIMTSALLAKKFNSSGGVRLWHSTVVASMPGNSFFSSECSNISIGRPTFFDLKQR